MSINSGARPLSIGRSESMANKKGAKRMEESKSLMPVTKQAVKDLKAQRELLREFVQSQLVEADFSDAAKNLPSYGEGDFGIIPGTKKRCLLKAGAEKLLRLFNLGVRFRMVDKEVDKINNIALYTYRAEVYIIKTGLVVAECEATANSQEVKYRERTEWRKNEKGVRESHKVETPIFDVLNTLQKMAQKRALIGATLLATGASEFFTQDMLDPEDVERDVTPATAEPVQKESQAKPTNAPECCGQPMMISKYVDKEFGHKPYYCVKCRAKLAAESA